MNNFKILSVVIAVSLTACGGGGGGVSSEGSAGGQPVAVENPGVNIDPATVQTTDDLVAADTFDFSPSTDLSLKVDLDASYDNAYVLLCESKAGLTTPGNIDFDNCIVSARLDNGQLDEKITLVNTASSLVAAVLPVNNSAQQKYTTWANVFGGNTLVISD